ncbi:MAG: hypothetical protein FWF75_07940 [Propionibacteriaceae bacterium]|nr:hypothetical protein [Propionibacteriaceae bacterium]
MAEIRKHNPHAGSDIGEQVRQLMGETIRPVEPGSIPGPAGAAHDHEDDALYDPFDQGEPASAPAPLTFHAATDPLIGTVPQGFISWVGDDDAA